jgi:hypothetical protein
MSKWSGIKSSIQFLTRILVEKKMPSHFLAFILVMCRKIDSGASKRIDKTLRPVLLYDTSSVLVYLQLTSE